MGLELNVDHLYHIKINFGLEALHLLLSLAVNEMISETY